MMQIQRPLLFETGSTDPCYNLAYEEYVLTHRLSGDILMLWQNDKAVIIGRNQNTAAEIDQSFVDRHGIKVVRRITGGGAVYHDLGNLNYSFITNLENAEDLVIARFMQPVVAALQALSLHAETSGRNDILVEGHKISGTAQRIHGNRILFHGTLLFETSPDMIAGALNADPMKFTSKAAVSVRSRVGNIRDFLKNDMTLAEFREYMKDMLSGSGYINSSLEDEELLAVERLKREKYDTWEWNYGLSPRYDFSNKLRFDGGIAEARIAISKGGRINSAAFYGDFLATSDITPLTDALLGIPYRREDVAVVLDQYPIQSFFGAITRDEILQLLFPQHT